MADLDRPAGLTSCAGGRDLDIFGIVFKPLNPVMDKVFGALMLWGAGFLLAGGLVRWRR